MFGGLRRLAGADFGPCLPAVGLGRGGGEVALRAAAAAAHSHHPQLRRHAAEYRRSGRDESLHRVLHHDKVALREFEASLEGGHSR